MAHSTSSPLEIWDGTNPTPQHIRSSESVITRRSPEVRLRNVTKNYGPLRVVDDVDLTVEAGEFLTILGPSGSGKTTLLMLLAGFAYPTGGEIEIGGRLMNNIPAYKRNVGVVFQNYSLFPHMTVSENLAFPLLARKANKSEVDRKVNVFLDMIQMEDRRNYLPGNLSGGQQQRVALARAMIFQPEIILMDEPLGALDRQLRDRMQEELMLLHRASAMTIIYVTHDQTEALAMSSRVAVFNKGKIEQLAPPRTIYELPTTEFVASFVGEMNWLDGAVVGHQGGGPIVSLSNGVRLHCTSASAFSVGSKVRLGVRPENVRLADGKATQADCEIGARIKMIVFLGQRIKVTLTTNLDRSEIQAILPCVTELKYSIGDNVTVLFRHSLVHVFPDSRGPE